MGKYLKKFENHSAYEAAESGLILPNVSLCVQEHDVHYNPSTPTPSHDYVEIGGIKWATMNVGATGVTDYGLYFQWGDTQGYTAEQVGIGEGKKYFSWVSYKYGNGSSTAGKDGENLIKYNKTDGLTALTSDDDAVIVNWGSGWRMPTSAEYQTLGTATTSAWTADYQGSGVSGLVCTDKTDSSKVLFFPAAGYCYDANIEKIGNLGCYFSSSLHSSSREDALGLNFSNWRATWNDLISRRMGCPIRAILDE